VREQSVDVRRVRFRRPADRVPTRTTPGVDLPPVSGISLEASTAASSQLGRLINMKAALAEPNTVAVDRLSPETT
jgi:hypothetical protein